MDDFLNNHPLLRGMPQNKLNFIMQFATKDKPKNLKDAMPFLLANMNLAKKQNIQFSNQEIHLIADILSQNLSADEQKKVNQIMSMFGQ